MVRAAIAERPLGPVATGAPAAVLAYPTPSPALPLSLEAPRALLLAIPLALPVMTRGRIAPPASVLRWALVPLVTLALARPVLDRGGDSMDVVVVVGRSRWGAARRAARTPRNSRTGPRRREGRRERNCLVNRKRSGMPARRRRSAGPLRTQTGPNSG
jgi:hypothetical protein